MLVGRRGFAVFRSAQDGETAVASSTHELHAPVDANELSGLEWKPNILALDRLARKN
jgi:hypothetical protein